MAGSKSFSPDVIEKLRHYVYRLIDPRNEETFYVGKGCGNRVFSHARAESTKLDGDADDLDNKMARIRDIRKAGLKVVHVIHRHGMDAATALEVEAALIDCYPEISNVVGGIDSGDRGAMHAQEIIGRYATECAEFQHNELLINVAKYDKKQSVYEATRYAWKINPAKAEKAKVVLATNRGLIVGAFVAQQWLEATAANFPGHEPARKRFGFKGKEAPTGIKNLYVGKRVPDKYQRRGAANPVRYTW